MVSTDEARADHHRVDWPPPNSKMLLPPKVLCERKSIAGYVYHGNGAPSDAHAVAKMLLFQCPVLALNLKGVITPVANALMGCQAAFGRMRFSRLEVRCSHVTVI